MSGALNPSLPFLERWIQSPSIRALRSDLLWHSSL
ncbi:hypothetical protein Godav_013542, partial [Gossypium davidsonii]|nr:hypothetical protein [Gossypium davidsonii]